MLGRVDRRCAMCQVRMCGWRVRGNVALASEWSDRQPCVYDLSVLVLCTYLVEQQPDQAAACCESLFTGLALYLPFDILSCCESRTPTDDIIYVSPGRSALAPPATLQSHQPIELPPSSSSPSRKGCERQTEVHHHVVCYSTRGKQARKKARVSECLPVNADVL